MKGSVGTGIGLDADVNAPSLGKNYEVWRSESFRKGPRKGPDDGVIFRYRVLVKFAQFMPGDFEGFGHHSVEPADDM
jgi:hypothetical protein